MWNNDLYIFQTFKKISNVHQFLQNFERILIWMIKRAEIIKIDEIRFYNTFQHLWFTCVFDPKNHEF
jgi:hypothetical protein